MHGDKRWIYDYKGRLKKSSDRTFKDWCGDLNRYSWKESREEERNCDECQARREEYGHWIHPRRWDYDTRSYYYDSKWEYFYTPPKNECEYHRWKEDVRWHSNGRKWWYYGVPSEFRRTLNKKYRTRVNQQMRDAKYNEDLYDMIPKPQSDAAWLWW